MKELLDTGVQIGLTYYEREDALIGSVKGYSAAVRENLATGSYGILLWVRKGEYAAVRSAEEYLEERKKREPDLIRNFRVTDRGTAIALARTEDAFANLTNLKRFLYDFADHLSLNFYINCCCECGAAETLGIYDANGVITQACGKCGAQYRPILPAAGKAAPDRGTEPDALFSERPSEASAPAAFAEESALKKAEPDGFGAKPGAEPDEKPAPEKIAAEPAEKAAPAWTDGGFEALLFGAEEPEKPEPPRSALFEEAEREFRREQEEAALSSPTEEPEDDGFDDLFFDEGYEEPPELPPEEPKRAAPVPEVGFSELLINEDGEVELKKEEPEVDDGTVVTEIRDDSNDGAPIDVTEIESLVLNPTVTTGHPQLDAEETPLGRDGSVPLVNPNANREEKQISSPDGPDAVTPLSEDKNAYAASARPDEGGAFAVGYASSYNMIDRDAPDVPVSEKRRPAPPPYNQKQEYGAGLSGAPAPYDPSNVHSSYVRRSVARSNAFMGIVGALTCGAVGAVIWVLIAHYLGVIGRIGAIAIVLTTFGGYYLVGRAMDKKGIVISSVLSMLMTLAGVAAYAAVEIRSIIEEVFAANASLFESFGLLNYLMQSDAAVKDEFTATLGFSLTVSGILVIVSAIFLWRRTD